MSTPEDPPVALAGVGDAANEGSNEDSGDAVKYPVDQMHELKIDMKENQSPQSVTNDASVTDAKTKGPTSSYMLVTDEQGVDHWMDGTETTDLQNTEPEASNLTIPSESKDVVEDDEPGNDDGNASDVVDGDGAGAGAGEGSSENKPKKKKKKKRSAKNKAMAPSGFEEFYADPPMMPSEVMEDEDQYNPDLYSFDDRIQTCIQKYRSKRKFNSERGHIFTRYLILGGIDAGSRPFSSGLDIDLKSSGDRETIQKFTAVDYITRGDIRYYDPNEAKHWVVDFEGVAKGFLSNYAHRFLGLYSKEKIKECCNIVKNFLTFVMFHGVCPEYHEELTRSRMLCDQAQEELVAILDYGKFLPGTFNIACSTLFGGAYKGLYSPEREFERRRSDDFSPRSYESSGMSESEAKCITNTAIALFGTEDMRKGAATCHVVKEEIRSFEVIEIIRSSPGIQEAYAEATDHNNEIGNLKPLGILKVKDWDNPDDEPEDRSDDGTDSEVTCRTEELWMEDEFLKEVFVGLKIKVRLHETNTGLKYFDTVLGLYCSFFTVLPQDRMEGYKPIVLSERPGPMAGDAERDEAEGGNLDVVDEEDEEEQGPELSWQDATVRVTSQV